jgi:hypothetical protein
MLHSNSDIRLRHFVFGTVVFNCVRQMANGMVENVRAHVEPYEGGRNHKFIWLPYQTI